MGISGWNVGNIHHGFTQANSSVSVNQGLPEQSPACRR